MGLQMGSRLEMFPSPSTANFGSLPHSRTSILTSLTCKANDSLQSIFLYGDFPSASLI